jgi:hypothetical protein
VMGAQRVKKITGSWTVAELEQKVQHYWGLACEHEGVPPTSQFVTFHRDNPFNEDLNEWTRKLLFARRCSQAVSQKAR